MYKNKSVSVIIPTLNEAKGIKDTLLLVPTFVDEIVVVDGDSKDGTRDIAASWGKENNRNVKVINEKRRGYGRAFKTGFENSTGEIIVTGDGDGTYPVEVAGEVIDHMIASNLVFVSCSRFPLQDRASMRKRNMIGNIALTAAATVLFFYKFDDVLSGMWVFNRECLKKLALFSDSWNFSEEIKIQAVRRLGKQFGEFKITYRERLGETKLVPWKVGLQNIGYMLAMRTGTVPLLQSIIKKTP